MPKISVIVPVYKVQAYVAECLKSLLSQTFRDIEVICVNDASPDLSGVILRKIAEIDSRVKIITHPKNMGGSCARNTGLEVAIGEYVHFMDSDDKLKTDCYQNMWDLVSEHNFPDMAIFYRTSLYDMWAKSLSGITVLETPEDKSKILSSGAPWYKFSRIDFVRNFKFPPRIMLSEDEAWSWMTVLSAKSIPICPKRFYYYRKVPTGLMSSKSMLKARHQCEAYSIIKQWLIRNGHWDDMVYRNRFMQSMQNSLAALVKYQYGTKEEVDKCFKIFPILSDMEDTTDYLAYLPN